MEQFVYKNHQKLRYGYTTGSCAAAAAKAAAIMLLSEREIDAVELMTPKQIPLYLQILNVSMGAETVSCAVKKDSGDDPDVTDGILVYAEVSYQKSIEGNEIQIEGGKGVGRITKPGLEQPVGAAAINRVPRQMIQENVQEVCRKYGYTKGLSVCISIPEGEALAAKTFNPRLGIIGGISVLGTSGIVEPMSEQALIDTIRVEIRQRITTKKTYLLIVPGNYGIDFLAQYGQGLSLEDAVKCSNFVGEALDAAVEYGAKGVLLIGHIGKFIKLAGGIMNTHSHNADARMELLTVHAALLGVSVEVLSQMMESVTTDDALRYLQEQQMIEPVMERVMERIEFYVNQRTKGKLTLGVLTFSKVYGILGETEKVGELARRIAEQ